MDAIEAELAETETIVFKEDEFEISVPDILRSDQIGGINEHL